MEVQDGKIIERDIENEMKTSYIDYAMSVMYTVHYQLFEMA